MLEISVLTAIRPLIFTMSMIYSNFMLIALTHHHNKRDYMSKFFIHPKSCITQAFPPMPLSLWLGPTEAKGRECFTQWLPQPFKLSYCFGQPIKWQCFVCFEWQIQFNTECRFGGGDLVLQDQWITNFVSIQIPYQINFWHKHSLVPK